MLASTTVFPEETGAIAVLKSSESVSMMLLDAETVSELISDLSGGTVDLT